MKALPDPTLRYVAPAITVNIPANTQLGHSSPALRLKVTPHVLLPSPPFSPAIRSLKAVETHVQTVVPLGSLIECSIRLEGCADDIDEGATAASPALHIVVKTFISALSKALDVSCSQARNAAVLSSDQMSGGTLPTQISSQFDIFTQSAQPRESDLISGLILPGLPKAFLSKLEVQCEWADPVAKGQGTALKASTPGSDADDEDNEGMAPDTEDEQGEAGPLEAAAVEERSSLGTAHALMRFSREVTDPPWREQLCDAVRLLATQHLVRRFPLVFDSRVPEFAETVTIPRALITSFSSFRHISTKHDTDLSGSIVQVLRAIQREQRSRIAYAAREAANMPELAVKKRDLVKKRAARDKRERKALKRLKRRDGNAHHDGSSGTRDDSHAASEPDLLDAEARVDAYLESVGANCAAQREENSALDELDISGITSQAIMWIAASTYFTPKKIRRRQIANRLKKIKCNTAGSTDGYKDTVDEAECKEHIDWTGQLIGNHVDVQDHEEASDFEWAEDTDDELEGQEAPRDAFGGHSPEARSPRMNLSPEKTEEASFEADIPRLTPSAREIPGRHHKSLDKLHDPYLAYRDAVVETDESLPDMPFTPTTSVAIYGTNPELNLVVNAKSQSSWRRVIDDDDQMMMSDISDSLSYSFDRMSMAPDSDMEVSVCT